MTRTRNYTTQHLASAMHFGISVQDPQQQLKLWKISKRFLQLVRPNATRWNSVFMAVERLLRIVKEKGETTMRVFCTDLKVPM